MNITHPTLYQLSFWGSSTQFQYYD